MPRIAAWSFTNACMHQQGRCPPKNATEYFYKVWGSIHNSHDILCLANPMLSIQNVIVYNFFQN
jgi:hypothetical protein